MKQQEFIREHFIEMHGNYYSRYDIAEKGFAFQDSSPYSPEDIDKEYEKFLEDKDAWLKEYNW